MPGDHGDVERRRRGRRAAATRGGRSARAPGAGCRALRRPARAAIGPLVVDGVPALAALGVEAHDPEAAGLQRLDGLGDVADRAPPSRARARPPRRAPRSRRGRRCGGREAATPSAPAASAVRRMAPRLRGSSTPSRTTTSAGSRASASSVLEGDHRLGRDHGDDALVRHAAGHAVEGLARLEAQRDAHLAGAGDGLGDAPVADPLHDQQPVEVARARRSSASRTGLMPQMRFMAVDLVSFPPQEGATAMGRDAFAAAERAQAVGALGLDRNGADVEPRARGHGRAHRRRGGARGAAPGR